MHPWDMVNHIWLQNKLSLIPFEERAIGFASTVVRLTLAGLEAIEDTSIPHNVLWISHPISLVMLEREASQLPLLRTQERKS